MKKKIIFGLLATSLGIGSISFPIKAAEVGNSGQVINGEYVVVVNTNTDPDKKQSTGTLVFDNSNLITTTSIEEKLDQESDVLYDIVEGGIEEASTVSLKNSGTSETYKVGDERQFYQGKTYVCIGAFDKSYIWMEKSMKDDYDAAGKTADIAEDMRATYESKPYDMLMELSNNKFPYNDGSGKLSILLEKTSNGSSGFYAGEPGITAIHINAPQASSYTKGQLSSTNGLLVHEGQHAIFRNLTCGGDAILANKYRWLDEGLAVASMDYTWGGNDPSGWLDYINGNLQLRNGSSLIYTSYRNSSAQDYSMPDLFVRYLANQMTKGYNPMKFFQTVYTVDAKNKDVTTFMNDLLEVAGLVDAQNHKLTFDKALEQFYTAIIAQDKEGVYGFYGDPVVFNKLKDYPIYMGESGESVLLPGTAAIVLKTQNGKFTVPTDGGSDIRYIAVNKSTTVSKPAKGSGTATDPYQIESASDLLTIGSEQSAHFVLTKDIDLTGSTYISSGWFSGNLDGKGYTIKGLTQPLVEKNSGKIQNLNIEANFKGDYPTYTGGIADINEGTITHCSVTGNFNVQMTGTQYGIVQTFGALVGRNEVSGIVRESFVDANINVKFGAQNGTAAALVGKNSGTIENSYSRGSLNVEQKNTGTYKFYVGGITGELNRDMGLGAVLKNCYSTTEITTNAASQSDLQAIGRLYGYGQKVLSTSVTHSYALEGMNAVGKTTAGIDTTAYEKTETELKQANTYTNWPFDSIWKIEERNDYPTFTSATDINTITVVLSPNEKERYIGEDLALYSAKLIVNGVAIPLTTDMVNGFDSSTEGLKKVTGSYKGKDFSFDITVKRPNKVENLVISTAGQTSFVKGDTYSRTGVVLMATLDGNQYRYIKSGFTSNLDGATLDNENQVTFNYCGSQVSQGITVKQDEPKSLSIVRSMNKVNYLEQDKLDFSGIGIQITYTSGKTSKVLAFDELQANGIRLVWEQNGNFTDLDVSVPLTKDKSEANIYACLGNRNPGQSGAVFIKVAKITVKDSLHLDDQVFVLGQNVQEFALITEKVSGGTAPYTFKLVEGKLPKGITQKSILGRNYLWFEGTPTEIGETNVVYEITDSTGNVAFANILFIVQVPSNVAEVESFSIINAQETYPGIINGTDIDFILPANIQLNNYFASVKLSEGSTYQQNFPPAIKEGTQTFTIVAQDGKTTKTYTLTIKKATSSMKPLDKPQNLSWNDSTTLTWDAVLNATGYIIEVKPKNDIAYTVSTTENKFDLSTTNQKSGEIELSVFAIGDNSNTYTSQAAKLTISYVAAPTIKYMSVNPNVAEVFKGKSQQFKVLISADQQADKTVTWSVEGATSRNTLIDSNGLLTVGSDEVASQLQIIATSNQDSSKQAKAIVTLKGLPKLNTPTNLTWQNQVAKWDAVVNATGYQVKLFKDGKQQGASVEVTDLEYDFTQEMTTSGAYTFSVKALGDGQSYVDGDATQSQVYDYVEPIKIISVTVTPSQVTVQQGKEFNFTATVTGTGAFSKDVQWILEGNQSLATTLKDGLLKVDAGEQATQLIVKAVSMQDQTVVGQAVVTVALKDLTQLAQPSNVRWDGTVAKWDAVVDATEYRVELYKDQQVVETISTTTQTEGDFTAQTKEAGKYHFTVVSLGDGIDTVDSTAATSEQYIVQEVEIPETPGDVPDSEITDTFFTDVEEGKWYTQHINDFVQKGFIQGYSDGTFRPNNVITRAEFVKIVNLAFGLTDKVTDLPFTDLDTEWKKEELKIALAAGYITPATTFRHNDPINRQEAAKIVGSLLNLQGDGKVDFADKDLIASWAINYVDALVDGGILTSNSEFRPQDPLTRAEAVKMLNLASQKVK